MFYVMVGVLFLLLAALFDWMIGKWLSFYRLPLKKSSARLLRLGLAGMIFLLWRVWSPAGLAALHLAAFFALTEAAAWPFRRRAGRAEKRGWCRGLERLYRTGLIPLALTCLLLGWGFYNMGRIVETEYTVFSSKLKEDREIVLLTDLHYGTVQKPEVFREKIQQINRLKPDLIVLGGDIVEEGASFQEMEQAFQMLGELESAYGTYYVYGNHDRQLYADAMSGGRAYTEEQLARAVQDNGIAILRDRQVEIGPDLTLAGREDRSYPGGRAPASALLAGADLSRFLIVADHQPVEVAENAALGADLQLSGHTHAGQIFPAGLLTEKIFGFSYGQYWQDGCCVIVSSGAAGWGFPVRTEKRCEYVVIHLKKE